MIRRTVLPKSNVSQEEREALCALRSEQSIVVLPADKGNATVVMDVEEYEKKALDLIEKEPFQRVSRDPTRRVEEGINKIIWKLFRSGKIK